MYDFFYVCLAHLTDRSFATRLDPSTPLSDEPAVQPASSSQSNATNEVQAATETLPPKDENPPLHSRYALHREFYAKRVRQFQPARTPIPTFPAVPGTTI
ncbi:hypothetical protein ACI68E_001691 [Malassezia pachydermatis]|uniref:Uncharacterized protein n=1 Tax=Malassezia pachydermatis TaxID=77020 RepID=A0A0M8MZC9_9BASI|nr:hypothetical protein Malapachy_3126 [Malassezia pachydermatis]KOS16581.1 hypothetical protein Malapachy_3126 [Malassezia pachydermatis]